MKKQYDHNLMSSFLLYVDNKVLQQGEAYYDASGLFYDVEDVYKDRYTYASPFKQMVSDFSVTGETNPTIMRSVYVDGVLHNIGDNGLLNINHYKGTVNFDREVTGVISGNFSVKDVNVYLTTSSDQKLIFETKFFQTPKFSQTMTGLGLSDLTLPAIFLKKRGGENDGFALGGLDETIVDVRAIVVSDTQYINDAVCSILKDTKMKRFQTITSGIPFDIRGAYTGVDYNYTGVTGLNASNPTILIKEVRESTLNSDGGADSISNNLYVSFVDFELSQVRKH